jgi:hypothetical protein
MASHVIDEGTAPETVDPHIGVECKHLEVIVMHAMSGPRRERGESRFQAPCSSVLARLARACVE